MANDMRDIILSSPQQISHSQAVNQSIKIDGDFDSIILAGMGGSGHPGDLLNALGLATRPLFVHRNYGLPLEYFNRMGFSQPLVITSSYSGNTEEALTAYQQARKNNLSVLVSSSGGQLEELARADSAPMAKIDYPGMQPRHTLFAAFAGIYTALKNSRLAQDIDSDLQRVEKVLQEKTPALEQPAAALAEKIAGKVPVFTSTDNLGFATKNFKIQTNENAKHPAFWSTFPELNHNELVGFSKLQDTSHPNQFFVLFIRDPDDHPRNKARIDVTKSLYKKWGIAVEEFTAEGSTLLEKIFYTVQFGLWTTYYLAKNAGIDPVPVEGVEDFKAKLKEIAGEA